MQQILYTGVPQDGSSRNFQEVRGAKDLASCDTSGVPPLTDPVTIEINAMDATDVDATTYGDIFGGMVYRLYTFVTAPSTPSAADGQYYACTAFFNSLVLATSGHCL